MYFLGRSTLVCPGSAQYILFVLLLWLVRWEVSDRRNSVLLAASKKKKMGIPVLFPSSFLLEPDGKFVTNKFFVK